MATLAAVQLEDLPVVVKFILHAVSASDAYEVRAAQHSAFRKYNIVVVLYFEIENCGVYFLLCLGGV